VFGFVARLVVVVLAIQYPRTGTITGRILFADSKGPAADISITCIARDRSISRDTTTDTEGMFQCELPPGVYRVQGRVSGTETRYLTQQFGAATPGDEARWLRVRSAERVDASFALQPAGAISGRVLDPDGTPVKYCIVTIEPDPADNDGLDIGTIGTAVTTGDDAAFSIAGLAPGVYRLRVDPPERSVVPDKEGRRLLTTWYPGTPDPMRSLPIQIVSGSDMSAVEIRLMRGKPVSITGHVFRADGSPAINGTVALLVRTARTQSMRDVRTDDKGIFAIPSVLPGSYELMASADASERAWQSIVVADGEPVNQTVQLRPNGSVHGRIRFEGGDAPGTPLTVLARNRDWRIPSGAGVTDDAWSFTLPFARGEGLLRFTTLPSGWWLKSVTLARRDITNNPIDLSDGAAGIEIVVSKRMATVRGAIEPPDTEVSPNVSVVVFSQDASSWIPDSTRIRRVWPKDDGRFVAEGLPPGAYKIVAVDKVPRTFASAPAAYLASVMRDAKSITLGEQEVVEVTLPLPYSTNR
jgi:protocatechuate 3,4-dioxygenase beta subunit